MTTKEQMAIGFLVIVEYAVLFFNWHVPVAIVCAIGIVPVYLMFDKALTNLSKEEYRLEHYTHDLIVIGISALASIAVFMVLFLQERLSFQGGFSIALTLLIYFIIYVDFLRKKFCIYAPYSTAHQSINKGAIGLMLFLLYNILYYG
jgi:hypothetical protein